MTNVLPDHLRTDHWYCDLHHAMLVIMFKRLVPALRGDNRHQAAYFVDNVTMYWLLHCLMEEEGFAHAVTQGRVEQALVDRHAQAHLKLLESWRDSVFLPFKQGTTNRETLARAADGYYQAVLHHIETMDQDTYGTASAHDSKSRRQEIAHIATAGLPLSPFMDGALDTTRRLIPQMAVALNKRGVTGAGKAPPPTLLPGGATTGLRAELTRAIGLRPSALGDLGRQLMAA